jgi:hypothetical protein
MVGSTPALAQTQPADLPPPADSKKLSERLVCKTIEQIGSRVASKRTCMTAQQWDEQQRTTREDIQRTQERTFQPRG